MENTANEKKGTGSMCIVIQHRKDAPENSCIAVEGFANRMKYRKVKVEDREVGVVQLDLTASLPDHKVRWLFGEELVNEYHNVHFQVSFWDRNAEFLKQYPPYEGQLVTVGITGMKIREWNDQEGRKRYTVQGVSKDTIGKRGWKREDAERFVLDPEEGTEPPEDLKALGFVFASAEDLGEGELPF